MINLEIGKKNRIDTYNSDYKQYRVADYGNKEIHDFYLQYFAKQDQVERYNYAHGTSYDVEAYEKIFGKIRLLGFIPFSAIVSAYNKAVTEKLLDGDSYNLGLGIAHINIVKIKPFRGIRKDGTIRKAVDWKATRIQNLKKDGKLVPVYKTDSEAFRITWHRNTSNIKNSYIYNFKASGNFVKAMFERLRKDVLVTIKYSDNNINKTPFKLTSK